MRVVVVRHHEEDNGRLRRRRVPGPRRRSDRDMFPRTARCPARRRRSHRLAGRDLVGLRLRSGRSWISGELDWLRRLDAAGVPVLGICFGAQALAAAFGGEVKPAARKEVGWTTSIRWIAAVIEPGPWLEFHGDQCHPPPRPGCSPATIRRPGVRPRPPPGRPVPSRGGRPSAQPLAGDGGRAEAQRAGAGPGPIPGRDGRARNPPRRGRAYALVAAAIRGRQARPAGRQPRSASKRLFRTWASKHMFS